MFDLSFPELAVVALLALLVFGPQELGRIMYGLGRIVRRLQYLRFALSQQFEDFMQKAGDADPASQVNFESYRTPPAPSAPSMPSSMSVPGGPLEQEDGAKKKGPEDGAARAGEAAEKGAEEDL